MNKVGVQSGNWYDYDDPKGSIKFIKECGFETIDYNIDNKLPGNKIKRGEVEGFFDMSIDEMLEYHRPLKEALAEYGVGVSQMHAPFPLWIEGNDEVNDYMIMTVEKSCAVARYIGCPAIVVHPITIKADKLLEWDINMDMYRKMMPFAKKYGVKLCLENLFTSFNDRHIEGACSDVHEACRYLDTLNYEAGEDIFGFCLDVGHANLMGRNIYQYITFLGDRLTILHIHDNDASHDLHLMPYTQAYKWGQVLYTDWEGFVNGLHDIGYKGDLCFETFRAVDAFPEEIRGDALKLISAIGRYFVKRIQS